jgi:tetratricopeptide (TPR) repeat protein
MEILKKQIALGVAFLLSLQVVLAQNPAAQQQAFKESYVQEYNKQYAEAIASLNKVYDEKSYEINLRLGWLHYQNKNYQQSQQFYQKAANLKTYSVEARLGLVKPLAILENWDKVMDTYEEILKIDPQNYTANYWAGVINYNRKKYDVASKLFEKIVNLYPFDYDGNYMLGWSYVNLGKTAEAKILFNKGLLNKPGDSSCLDALSKIK